MSRTQTLLPIGCALASAEAEMNNGGRWTPINDQQAALLDHPVRKTNFETVPELEGLMSYEASDLNRFLSERGFSISLEPFVDPKDFGVAIVMNVLVEWLEEGALHFVQYDGVEYSAVSLENEPHGLSYVTLPGWEHPVACISTKSGDTVYVTKMDASLVPDLITTPRLPSIHRDTIQRVYGFSGVRFPMVDLDEQVDVSWIVGMETTDGDGDEGRIGQAVQQTKFKMNCKGAKAESAFAMSMTFESCRVENPLIIDGPFAIWIERPGIETPLFFGHITPEDWKNPGEL